MIGNLVAILGTLVLAAALYGAIIVVPSLIQKKRK